MHAVQAAWYRREDMEKLQAALRPDFMQVSEPMKLLPLLNT